MRDIQSYFRQGGNKGDMSLFSHMFWKKTAQTDYLLDWTVLFDRSSSSQNGSRSAKCVRTHTHTQGLANACIFLLSFLWKEIRGRKFAVLCQILSKTKLKLFNMTITRTEYLAVP